MADSGDTMKRLLIAAVGVVALMPVVGLVLRRRFEARCARLPLRGALVPAPGGPVHLWCEGAGAPGNFL
jgi:hypothetical protein